MTYYQNVPNPFQKNCYWPSLSIYSLLILYYRVICRPFKRRLSKVSISAVSLGIMACSLVLAIDNTSRLHYKDVINYIDGTPVILSICNAIDPHQKITLKQLQTELVWYSIGFSVGIVLPMIILLVTHLIMYLKLRRQARRMSRSSTEDQNQRLRNISRTFIAVVLAFYICVFPHFCMHMYEYYLKISKRMSIDDINHHHDHAHNIFTITTYFNCCLNPFIYSKIHKRIFAGCKCVWKKLKKVLSKVFEENNLKGKDTLWPNGTYKGFFHTHVGTEREDTCTICEKSTARPIRMRPTSKK